MSKQQFITALQAAELRDQNNYPQFDANSISLDRLNQLIEQEAPYTNFIVLKGRMRADRIELLEMNHYAVDQPDCMDITVINWPII